MKRIPVGASIDDTTIRFEDGYECPPIHITEQIDAAKRWLRTLPTEQRQLIIDELIACTLRTLEVDQ